MIGARTWRVDIYIGEDEGRTYAEARLHTDLGDRLSGIGLAKVHPNDRDIPEIGDELAVARALTDLGHRLLVTTSGDIRQVTGEESIELKR
jgi:hypothetical protein